MSFNTIGSDSKNYNDPLKNDDDKSLTHPIQTLPFEILAIILSSLDKMSMQQTVTTSRHWSIASIEGAKRQEPEKINVFSEFLGEKMPIEYEDQRKILFSIKNNTNFIELKTLKEVKSSICNFREIILNVLKDLKVKDRDNLEKLSQNIIKPNFFEDIFFFASLYKDIDEAKMATDPSRKSYILQQISVDLSDHGYFDKAIEVANTIPDENERLATLSFLSDT